MYLILIASLILPIFGSFPLNYLTLSDADADAFCVVYFDYRNPPVRRLTVLPQHSALNYTLWEKCARKCSDFALVGHEKRQWNHTCHPGKEMDCKITFNWGKLSAAGECPSLYNYEGQRPQQQQQDKSVKEVYVSGMCVLFADNRTASGFRTVELQPPEWKLQQFGTCAQKCVKFGPNHGEWKITCNLPSGDQCQIRRANLTYGMHGNCPVMRENGTFYFTQLFTNWMAEKRTLSSSAAAATDISFFTFTLLILWPILLLFGHNLLHFGIVFQCC